MNLPPLLSPKLNPAGLSAAALAVYAAAVMIYNVATRHGVIDVPVVVAAAAAVASLLTRQAVTPVASPRDNAGRQLVPLTETRVDAMIDAAAQAAAQAAARAALAWLNQPPPGPGGAAGGDAVSTAPGATGTSGRLTP